MAELKGTTDLQSTAANRVEEHHIVKGSSHQQMTRPGYANFTWAFHDTDEIGPKMLARIAKRTGLTPQDL